MPEQKETLLDRVKGMAKELGLEAEEAEKYINQHMEKAGWVRNTNWTPPDGKESKDGKGSGWFSE